MHISKVYGTNLVMIGFLFALFIIMAHTAPQDEKIAGIPGYPDNFNSSVYAGYLKTSSQNRKLHYVFIENYKGAKNTLPVTVWMNGGPGCASKIGLLQQIAPYLLPLDSPYIADQDLIVNPHTWLNLTNILFIDNPAGVGYSVNTDSKYIYNDKNTAQDTLDAIVDFFTTKFPQYLPNQFYLTGESYAGKYIPDLALLIYAYNSQHQTKQINLKGLLLGNPAIQFKSGSLEDSNIQFMMSHQFVDPKIYPSWKTACHSDPQSAGCQYFYFRYEQLLKRIDFYNIYGPCLDGKTHASQAGFMKTTAKRNSRIMMNLQMDNDWPWTWTQFSQCFNDQPINDYFTINYKSFNSQVSKFNVCNSTIYQNYDIQQTGSIQQLQSLIGINSLKVYFFSGDFDDVIPFSDTDKNLQRMGLQPDGIQENWKIQLQHIGFKRSFKNKKNVKFFIIKGAGHEAVAYKPEAGYDLFSQFIAPL